AERRAQRALRRLQVGGRSYGPEQITRPVAEKPKNAQAARAPEIERQCGDEPAVLVVRSRQRELVAVPEMAPPGLEPLARCEHVPARLRERIPLAVEIREGGVALEPHPAAQLDGLDRLLEYRRGARGADHVRQDLVERARRLPADRLRHLL